MLGIQTTEVVAGKDSENRFGESVKIGISAAEIKIRSEFENNKDPDKNLEFHNWGHTEGVISRTEILLKGIGATEREIQLGKLIAAWHDTVQDSEREGVKRKRGVGNNERKSAEGLISFMDQENARAGGVVFSEGDKNVARLAIEATIPGFNPDLKTVVQPNLNKDLPLVAQAVAWADLAEAGMDPEAYARGGKALFREENMDIAGAIRDKVQLDDATKASILERAKQWMEFQVPFAKGRQTKFAEEASNFPSVLAIVNKFDESIGKSKEAVAQMGNMNFDQAIAFMGYN